MPIVGVAGGSGSGKTTLARSLFEKLGPARSAIILQDSYYIDRSREFRGDGTMNFDHPEALDWQLMIQHIGQLRQGRAVEIPTYDFATHSRTEATVRVEPKDVIIVDGILILHPPELRQLFDYSIYVDCAEPLRFERRLQRDVEERGRTPEGVKEQYRQTVLPMHNQFVEPSKKFADLVVPGDGDCTQYEKSIFASLAIN